MTDKLNARGKATVRLADKSTGAVVKEITAHNTLNLDFITELKNTIFNFNTTLTMFLSDFDKPSPDNGLIFPMGHICGRGKYNAAANGLYVGAYSALSSVINKQEKGLTTSMFVWDFAASQAAGTVRSIFLYWDAISTRFPALTIPTVAWKGTPRWAFESKLFDNAAKPAVQYNIVDYYTKEAVLHAKSNTLTINGIARDVDSKHIFVFDAAVKKLYEYADIDTDMTEDNILAEYSCTKAYPMKGLVSGKYLYYAHTSTDPLTTAHMTGTVVYLYRYDYTKDTAPEVVDSLTCLETGLTTFTTADPCAFIDDYLIYHHSTNAVSNISPVIRIVGGVPRIGFTGVYQNASNQMVQRVSPNRQVLVSGAITSANMVPPMAISHLLLPEAIIKDNQHTLTVSYTLSIQD